MAIKAIYKRMKKEFTRAYRVFKYFPKIIVKEFAKAVTKIAHEVFNTNSFIAIFIPNFIKGVFAIGLIIGSKPLISLASTFAKKDKSTINKNKLFSLLFIELFTGISLSTGHIVDIAFIILISGLALERCYIASKSICTNYKNLINNICDSSIDVLKLFDRMENRIKVVNFMQGINDDTNIIHKIGIDVAESIGEYVTSDDYINNSPSKLKFYAMPRQLFVKNSSYQQALINGNSLNEEKSFIIE